MALTPLDIESRRFRREVFGYSRREVDELLRGAADALSHVNLEREELTRIVQIARQEVDEYRSREKTLIEALAGAERLIEERKALAQQECERILADARREAEGLLGRTRSEVSRIEQQMLRLKVERETFENRLLSLIDEHKRLVEIRRQEASLSDKLRPKSSVPPPLSSSTDPQE
jgi:cell division initiation protein